MYQVYTHPKYREYGQKFFAGVDKRYTEYAKLLEGKLGISYQKLMPLIFILIRVCVHYALFEDEFCMKSQIEVLKEALELFVADKNVTNEVHRLFQFSDADRRKIFSAFGYFITISSFAMHNIFVMFTSLRFKNMA